MQPNETFLHDIECGHTTKLFGIKDAVLFQNLSRNRNGRVDGIGNNGQDGSGTMLGTSLDEGLDNAGVGGEQIVAGHTGFAGNSGGNHDHIGSGQSRLEAGVVGWWPGAVRGQVPGDGRVGRNVGQIRGDSGGSDNVVEGQFRDIGGELEQQTQGLANSSVGSQYCDFLSHG